MEDISVETANSVFTSFMMNIRKENGEVYPQKTLCLILGVLHRYLQDSNPQFQGRKGYCPPIIKEIKELAHNDVPDLGKQCEIITFEQEKVLFDKGLLGTSNADILLTSIVYKIGLEFGVIAGRDHRAILPSHIAIDWDTSGKKYLKFTGNLLTASAIKSKVIDGLVYENPDDPLCLVMLHEFYMSKW